LDLARILLRTLQIDDGPSLLCATDALIQRIDGDKLAPIHDLARFAPVLHRQVERLIYAEENATAVSAVDYAENVR
jgi:hypothetical protein